MADKKIEQPEYDLQHLQDEILAAVPSRVEFLGKTRSIKWFHKGTRRLFSHIMMTEKDEYKRNAKLCAVVLLNGLFMLRLCYAFYWRWLYYVKDPDPVDVLRLLDASKKKIPSTACSLVTILSTGMSDLMMNVAREEARATQAERAGAQATR